MSGKELEERQRWQLAAPSISGAALGPAVGDLVASVGHDPLVGDGGAVGVPGEVSDHLQRTTEGCAGMDLPVDLEERVEERVEGVLVGERSRGWGVELELAVGVQLPQPGQQSPSHPGGERTCRVQEVVLRGPHELVGLFVQPGTREDDVYVGVVAELAVGGVQDGEDGWGATKEPRIGSEGREGLLDAPEEEPVQQGLVGQEERVELPRHGEDVVEVGHREQLGFTGCGPLARLDVAAPWTVTILAAVATPVHDAAVGAGSHLPPQQARSTRCDTAKNLQTLAIEPALAGKVVDD